MRNAAGLMFFGDAYAGILAHGILSFLAARAGTDTIIFYIYAVNITLLFFSVQAKFPARPVLTFCAASMRLLGLFFNVSFMPVDFHQGPSATSCQAAGHPAGVADLTGVYGFCLAKTGIFV